MFGDSLILAPVVCWTSAIFAPPFPMMDPAAWLGMSTFTIGVLEAVKRKQETNITLFYKISKRNCDTSWGQFTEWFTDVTFISKNTRRCLVLWLKRLYYSFLQLLALCSILSFEVIMEFKFHSKIKSLIVSLDSALNQRSIDNNYFTLDFNVICHPQKTWNTQHSCNQSFEWNKNTNCQQTTQMPVVLKVPITLRAYS